MSRIHGILVSGGQGVNVRVMDQMRLQKSSCQEIKESRNQVFMESMIKGVKDLGIQLCQWDLESGSQGVRESESQGVMHSCINAFKQNDTKIKFINEHMQSLKSANFFDEHPLHVFLNYVHEYSEMRKVHKNIQSNYLSVTFCVWLSLTDKKFYSHRQYIWSYPSQFLNAQP